MGLGGPQGRAELAVPVEGAGAELPPVLLAASLPWAFTQEYPLRTDEFCKEAARRRIDLREEHLRGLWRAGLLAPFVEVRNERHHHPRTPLAADPRFACGV